MNPDEERLQRILARHGDAALPDWAPERGFLEDWIREYLAPLWRWIASWWPRGEDRWWSNLDPKVVAYAGAIVGGLILVATVFLVLRRWLRADRPARSPRETARLVDAAVAAARARGQYARAARLLWRNFLSVRGERPSRTPGELGGDFERFNRPMFSGTATAAELADMIARLGR